MPGFPNLVYRTDTCAALCYWRRITELYLRFNNRYRILVRLSRRTYDSDNMAVEEKTDSTVDEIEWNVDTEVQLFYAMYGHKPVGKI